MKRHRSSRSRLSPPIGAILLAAAAFACSDEEPVMSPDISLDVQRPPASSVQQRPASSLFEEGQPAPLSGPRTQSTAFPCAGGEDVLLVQDNVPWFAPGNQHPLGANVTELLAQNKNFCLIGSAQIGATDLTRFPEILISAAQNQTFYDNLFPGGTVHAALAAYVQQGGVLSANLTDGASGPGAGGSWDGRFFVGGVTHVSGGSNDNAIASATHPIVADALPCPSGNCAQIVDQGAFDDLDGWGSSDHGWFADLPSGTVTILADFAGRPVMVEYPFGQGVVIATMTTTEWRYVGDFGGFPQNKKLLANEIAYQDFIAILDVQIDIKPGSDPNSINPESRGVIPVALLGSADFDVSDADFSALEFGPGKATPRHRKGHFEDANGDGHTDLVSHYRTMETGLAPGDTDACLTGRTTGGRRFEGCDAVRVLGDVPAPVVDDLAPVISNLEPDASVTVFNPDANGNGRVEPGDYMLTFDAVDPPLSDGSAGSGVDETGCLAGGPCLNIAATVLSGPAGAPATFPVDNVNTPVAVDPDFLVQLHSGVTPTAPDGDYQIQLSVPDNLGNVGTAMWVFALDNTPPVHGALNPAPVGSSGTSAAAIVFTIGGSIDDANVIETATLTVIESVDYNCGTTGDNTTLTVASGRIDRNNVSLANGTSSISFYESFTVTEPGTGTIRRTYCFVIAAEDEAVLKDGTAMGNSSALTTQVDVTWLP